MINFVYYLMGFVMVGAGAIWLGVAWIWYKTFMVPYVWLVWVLTAPIWFITGAFFLSVPIGEKMRIRRLAHKGMRIQTKFFNVEINFRLKVNAQYPYVIQTMGSAPKSGEKLMFTSENIWFNPEPFVKDMGNIDVMIDPDDPSCYMMDISFLEKAVKDSVRKA